MKSATPKQRAFLAYLGIRFPDRISLDEAARTLDAAVNDERYAAKLSRWNIDKFQLHPDLYPAGADDFDWQDAVASAAPRKKRGCGAVAVAVIALATVAVAIPIWQAVQARSRTTSASATPLPVAEPVRPPPRAEPKGPAIEAAKARATAAYPALAQPGSALNKEFVARYRRYLAEKPSFFDNPEWPAALAAECVRQP